MTGHRPFSELRDELLRAPGAAERIAEERRLLDEEMARSEAGDRSPEADAPATDRSGREAAPPAPGSTRS